MRRNGDGADRDDPVILLDERGRARGSAPERVIHGPATPLHLGFACHLFDRSGRALMTRHPGPAEAGPGVWSNACRGHPQPGETLRTAVSRRLQEDLGVTATRMALGLSDFTYRAIVAEGVLEHELCPVVVAETDDLPSSDAGDRSGAEWIAWDALCERASRHPRSLSPWSAAQITELAGLRSPLDRRDAGCGDPLDAPLCPTPPALVPRRWPTDQLLPIADEVEQHLERFLAQKMAELVAIDPALAAVGGEIVELVSAGGKRLRPAFVYWGHRAAGGRDQPAVAGVAAAIEMLHTFALLHDDVMDRALTRRGRAAAHRALAEVHRADRLGGDPEWFGASAAILAGDLASVWADQLLDSAPLPEGARARVRRVFDTLRIEVMSGQYLELRLDNTSGHDPEPVRRVALLKSGRYTVTRPLQLGAAIADSDGPGALEAFGDAIGLAFQMRDDILGLFGDPAVTGKSNVEDLRTGKRTVLMTRAMSLATAAQRAVLEHSLGDPDLDDEAAARCREAIARSGALASVEALLRHQHAVAVDAVAGLAEPARGALGALAATALQRDR
jgi:isopentenyl-diphosphate delta-isomerase type 1